MRLPWVSRYCVLTFTLTAAILFPESLSTTLQIVLTAKTKLNIPGAIQLSVSHHLAGVSDPMSPEWVRHPSNERDLECSRYLLALSCRGFTLQATEMVTYWLWTSYFRGILLVAMAWIPVKTRFPMRVKLDAHGESCFRARKVSTRPFSAEHYSCGSSITACWYWKCTGAQWCLIILSILPLLDFINNIL